MTRSRHILAPMVSGENDGATDRAEEERERLRRVQGDLAYMSRVATMGELAASLAHEIKQPIAATVTNARTCARWLERVAASGIQPIRLDLVADSRVLTLAIVASLVAILVCGLVPARR